MSMTDMISNTDNAKQDPLQALLSSCAAKCQDQTQNPNSSASVKARTVVSGETNERKQKKAPVLSSSAKVEKRKIRRADRRNARESVVQRMRKFLYTDDEIDRAQVSENAVLEDALRWMKGAVPMEELSRLMMMSDGHEAAEGPRIWMAGSNERTRR